MRTNAPTPHLTYNPRSCRAPSLRPEATGCGGVRGSFDRIARERRLRKRETGPPVQVFRLRGKGRHSRPGGLASAPLDARSLLPDVDTKRPVNKPVLGSCLPRSRKTCRTGPKTSAGGALAAARGADSPRQAPPCPAVPRPRPRLGYERTNVSRETSCRRANGCSETDAGTRRTMRTAEQDSGLGCRSRPSRRQRRTRTAYVASAWAPSAKELGAEEVRQACSSLALNEMVRGVSRSSNATS